VLLSRQGLSKGEETWVRNKSEERLIFYLHSTISHSINGKQTVKANLLPDISMSLMAIPMLGSISKVVKALIRIDADKELSPIFDRRIPTPACSSI
jgi:hypothetical protein